MTRGRTPARDGWITIGVRLRASDVARLDAKRAATSRSQWIRQLVLDFLPDKVTTAATAPEEPFTLTPAEVRQLETAMEADRKAHEFYQDPEHLKPAGPGRRLQRDCTHPKARRAKGGLCMACGANVG